jgi:hypothetical protein
VISFVGVFLRLCVVFKNYFAIFTATADIAMHRLCLSFSRLAMQLHGNASDGGCVRYLSEVGLCKFIHHHPPPPALDFEIGCFLKYFHRTTNHLAMQVGLHGARYGKLTHYSNIVNANT